MAQLELTWRMPSTEPHSNWEQDNQEIATATTLPTHFFTIYTTFKCMQTQVAMVCNTQATAVSLPLFCEEENILKKA